MSQLTDNGLYNFNMFTGNANYTSPNYGLKSYTSNNINSGDFWDTYNNLGNVNNGLANYNSSNNNGTGIGWNTQTLAGIAGGLQALSGLANAYMSYKNYGLAKDQFNFQKGLANRNLANQAKVINNAYDNAAQVAAGMIGGKDSSGNYGMTSTDIINKYSNKAKEQHVDGSVV